MSKPGQVFLILYAVLYGALFTISDRWRPFFVQPGPQGPLRFSLAVFCYGVLPISWFLVVSRCFRMTQSTTVSLFAAVYLTLPLIGFHAVWSWAVGANSDKFYSPMERLKEPVKTTLELAAVPLDLWHVLLVLLGWFIAPIVILVLASRQT